LTAAPGRPTSTSNSSNCSKPINQIAETGQHTFIIGDLQHGGLGVQK